MQRFLLSLLINLMLTYWIKLLVKNITNCKLFNGIGRKHIFLIKFVILCPYLNDVYF